MITTIDPARMLSVSRTLAAPRELVLKAWSSPEMLTKWWGPFGFTTTTIKMDFQPGGEWIYTMHGPDGVDYPNYIRYLATGPDTIVWDHGTSADEIMFHVEVTLEEVEGGKTNLTFQSVFPTVEALKEVVEKHGAGKGLFQTVTRLDILLVDELAERDPFTMHLCLPSDTEIRTVRSLRAPKELVFKAYTTPEYIAQWQGPRNIKCTECSYDARVGGKWSMAHMSESTGDTYRFHGEILEIDIPNRLVGTFQFEDYDPMTNTTTFEEHNGITRVTTVSSFSSTENRDGMLYSGMEHGMVEGYERLQELFDSSATTPAN